MIDPDKTIRYTQKAGTTSQGPPSGSNRLIEVDAAIAIWLQAVERGERPNREAFFQQHAHLRDQLAKFFDDCDALDLASRSPSSPHAKHLVVEIEEAREAVEDENADKSEIPRHIGRYRVERLLGRGGFGLVYLAHDEQLQRLVAIKIPHSRLIPRPEDAAAYLTEARTVANLDHPNIVPAYDVGSTDQFPCYVVTKYIDGTDLSSQLKLARLNLNEAVKLAATIAEALHAAHKQGVVHRDVKPGNILLDRRGKPYISDFGLALREQDLGTGPRYAGTPAYMSPEQARGEGHRVDPRSDVFSLGVVFYELLVGQRPFRAESKPELLELITNCDPRPPRQYNDQIPKELERICAKAMSKRAIDRYSTADDFADDLRHFLNEAPQGSVHAPTTALRESEASFASAPADCAATAIRPSSDSRPICIVPKGLRSFDAHDAEFFLELLPGPRDRNGLPDSIRFWKTMVEETDPDHTCSVGLVYGPSGCGKSSLMKAGLLPRLSSDVLSVYVEATGNETESRLLNGLRKKCLFVSEDRSLKETMAVLRRGQGIPPGKKLLLVVDQFEQWLHSRKEEVNTELVQALRQCDGGRVQCILMVRDDFWLAATRFLGELEINLIQGENTALADLFDVRHAEMVLAAFGRAFGVLPSKADEESQENRRFLKAAVESLAQENKVNCVRLSLFAEMMKGRPWTPVTLDKVGGTQGIGVTFLEETFTSQAANPRHRLHQKAARAVLKALLPEAGTDLKGHMRSEQELLDASGYGSHPNEFEDLIRILDTEIRLLTPTDPEGVEGGAWRSAGDEGMPGTVPVSATRHAPPATRYYQLTHDYLVPSLRDWLTRKQKETRQGRAELRLVERAALWNEKRENRHLPTFWEYLTIVTLVPKKSRTVGQRKMLAAASRVHAMRWGVVSTLLLIVGFWIFHVVSTERLEKSRGQTLSAVDAVQSIRGVAVRFAIDNLEKMPRGMVINELASRYPNAEERHKLGLAYALAEYHKLDAVFLCSQIKLSAREEVDNFVRAFAHDRNESLKTIEGAAAQAESLRDWRLKSRLAIVALYLGDNRIATDMCRIDDRPDPVQRTILIDELPTWHGDLSKLASLYKATSDRALRSALCMSIGSIPLDRLTLEETADWTAVLRNWYQSSDDNVTHSAAGWALRQWNVDRSTLANVNQPSKTPERFVNSLGMNMLKIAPGQFIRRDLHAQNAQNQVVKLPRAFYLSDEEVRIGEFRQFTNDPACPKEEKPKDWLEPERADESHPQCNTSWYDAVLFCNWLSRKEGLTPCYARTGKKEKISVWSSPLGRRELVEFDEWQYVANGTGYRLPTVAEWEYACRAGTTTNYSCGTDIDLLRKYAVFTTGNPTGATPCGSKLPNGWGLFDMHGNAYEWCYDWNAPYGNENVSDPTGPAEPTPADNTYRVYRGGSWGHDVVNCQSDTVAWLEPNYRGVMLGFRLARNSAQ